MASPNPVPSRAALHALRGVILTTSCSVVLLAEERQRRLKIARTAIENARMLHLANNGCGPLAPIDVRREMLSQSSFPRPRTSTRRRRRPPQPSLPPSGALADDGGSSALQLERIAEASEMAAPPANIIADLQSRASSLLESDSFWHTHPKTRQLYRAIDLSSTLYPMCRVTSTRDPTRVIRSPNDAKAASAKAGRLVTQIRDGTNLAFVDNRAVIKSIRATDSAQKFLASSTPTEVPQAFYDEALVLLRRLVQDLAAQRSEAEVLDRLQLATGILQRLASLGRPTAAVAESLASIGANFLRRALDYNLDGATALVDSLLCLCKGPREALIALADFMHRGGSSSCMEQALEFLSKPKRRRRWMGGMLIHRILAYHGSSQEDFQCTKRLYQAFQDAGLFRQFNVSRATEAKIRGLMASKAIEAGDDALFRTETMAFSEIAPDAIAHDMKLQRLLLVREATLGQWDSIHDRIHDRIEMLRRCIGISAGWFEFHEALTHVTNMFAQSQTPERLEPFVRDMVAKYRMKLERRWFFLVFDRHASRRQADSAFSWLQFCCDNGLHLDRAFLQNLYSSCRKYWCFSDKSIEKLRKRLEAVLALGSGLDHDTMAHGAPSGSRRGSAVTPDCTQMAPKEWSLSGDRLRSTVVELLSRENSGIQKAVAAVETAYLQGVDVSEALTPILLARLKEGDDPNRVIHEALKMGVRIHGSAFNKASQALAARGNLRSSAHMCQIAARESAEGNLAYDEYNFSNLVFAYTGSGKYGALRRVLTEFTSEVLWWRGGRISLGSIKLAMKTVAMRAVVFVEEQARHREALNRLDEALMHVKRCRATRTDRHVAADTLVRIITAASRGGRVEEEEAVTSRDVSVAAAAG